MYLTSPNFKSSSVAHGFFTRKGGVSKGIYASLNCGLGSSDDKTNVIENRRRVAQKLGTDADSLCTLYQTHSADVITVEKRWRHSKLPRADAMVSNVPGIALGILTADCVPVLFADTEAGIIGATHAGWRGAIGGVLENTLSAMRALGARSITAAIGPSIAQRSYEVGAELKTAFTTQNTDFNCYFIDSTRAGHFLFDLKSFVRDRLSDAGVQDINLLENDTYIEEDDFFSFRRTTHRSEPDYGRQISAIMLTR